MQLEFSITCGEGSKEFYANKCFCKTNNHTLEIFSLRFQMLIVYTFETPCIRLHINTKTDVSCLRSKELDSWGLQSCSSNPTWKLFPTLPSLIKDHWPSSFAYLLSVCMEHLWVEMKADRRVFNSKQAGFVYTMLPN